MLLPSLALASLANVGLSAGLVQRRAQAFPSSIGFSTLWRHRWHYRSAAIGAVLINVPALAKVRQRTH